MKHFNLALSMCALALAALASGCSAQLATSASGDGYHIPLQLIDGGVAAQGTVQSQAIANIGTIYLEAQYPSLTVNGVKTQASGMEVNGQNIYVTYSYRDGVGAARTGGIQRFAPLNCNNSATLYTDYCLSAGGSLTFANSDVFAAASDGTNLYAVGSTLDNSSYPYYGRLWKIALSGSGDPLSVSNTATLNSYVGTSVALAGTNVLATYGTSSTNSSMTGGLTSFSKSTLAAGSTQSIYDARWVSPDPSSTSFAWVLTGAQSSSVGGKTIKYNADSTGSAVTSYTTGGNTIAESRSTVIVGNSLIISTAGDGGFNVICKATGAVLASKGAPVIANIPVANSVTNGIAAIPGYIFVANGEAGVYVYTIDKSNTLNSSYCQGITLGTPGRLALAADASGNTYVNAELSANSIKPVTIFNVLNAVTSRLLVVASGNKGISLLNVTNLTLSLTAVDDGF